MTHLDRRSFISWALALGGSLMLGGGVAFGSEEPDSIEIGTTLPFGGPAFFADDGLHQLLGYKSWVEDVNGRGGLLGLPVRLKIYDDKNDASLAADLFRKLLDEDEVELLLGNYGSGLARTTIPVVEAARRSCVFPMAWHDALWAAPHRYAAPLLPPAMNVCRPLASYLVSHGVKRPAVIWADNDYARDLAAGLRHWLADLGVEFAYESEYGAQKPLETALREAAATKPDALAGGNLGEDIPSIIAALFNTKLQFPMYAYFELDEPVLLKHREELEGAIGFGLYLPTMPFAGNRQYVHDFTWRWESEYPDQPIGLLLDHHSAAGYAAAEVTERAVKAAGTLDPETVRDALFSLDTETMSGRFRLDEAGIQVGKEVPVIGYRNGLRVTLWPDELRS